MSLRMDAAETILEAIARRRTLSFVYKGEKRMADPYILGREAGGALVLSAVQRTGGSGRGFRSFRVANLREVALTDLHFPANHPDYNPRDAYFANVVAKVSAREF